jgi:hydroxymethylbilane synthase
MHASNKLKIATRGSALALWQSHFIGKQLQSLGHDYELVIIQTTGDRVQDRFLHEIGGKGLFVKELEQALREGRADIAMHSLKDMPAVTGADFALPALMKRHSPADYLILHDKHRSVAIDDGNVRDWLRSSNRHIASSSLRRAHLLQGINKETKVEPIRGNVDTRLRKLQESSQWDAIILAEASLDRLSLKDKFHGTALSPTWFVPSPSQGVLAIESLKNSPHLELLSKLDDPQTRTAVAWERGLLAALGGDCTMPFAAHAHKVGNEWITQACVMSPNKRVSCAMTYTDAEFRNSTAVIQRSMSELGNDGLAMVLAELSAKK